MVLDPRNLVPDDRPAPVPPCRGLCRGERNVFDGPAKYGRTSDGQRVVWCTCHQGTLRRVTGKERDTAIAAGRFDPSVVPSGAALWSDDACIYDVVDIVEIKAK